MDDDLPLAGQAVIFVAAVGVAGWIVFGAVVTYSWRLIRNPRPR